VDRAEASRVAHGDLVLWNPLSDDALDEAISLLALPTGARALDVACGRAEVLRRVAERYDVEAMGYDADPALVETAPRGLDVRVADSPPDTAFDLVICIASSHALGGASADEMADFPGLMRAAEGAGLTPLYASVASPADWDRYEWRLILNCERSGHPDLRERAAAARARVSMPGGRETLGFALVLLRRDG
jgi:SAM-dependent methyltransferase